MTDESSVLDFGPDEMAELLEGAGWMLAGTAFRLAFSFFSRAVPARQLGAEKYGIFVLGFTIISITSFLTRMGLPQGITRYVPRYDDVEKQRGVVLTGFILATITSTILIIIIFVFSETISVRLFNEPRLTFIIRILVLLLLLLTYKHLIVSAFRALSLTRERVLIQDILFPVSKFVLIIGAIVAGFGLSGAAFGLLLAGLLSTLIAAFLLYSKSEVFKSIEFSNLMMKELLLFSFPLVVSTAYGTVLNYGDNLLIGYFLSSTEVGVYGISFVVSKLQTSILAGFGFLFFPMFSKFQSNEEETKLREFTKLVTKIVALLTVPVYLTLVFFSGQILSLFGQDYVIGSEILVILATGLFFHVILGLAPQGLMSYGYTKVVMVISATGAVLNILLNFYFIPMYGLFGAAFASALAYSTTSLVYTLILYQREEIHPFSRGLITILGFLFLTLVLYYPLQSFFTTISLWYIPLWTALFFLIEIVSYLLLNGIRSDDRILLNVLLSFAR